MKGLLNILFLTCFITSLAQNNTHQDFVVKYPGFTELGQKVNALKPEFYGLFLNAPASNDSAKLVIDEKGIYFLDASMHASTFFYEVSNEDHVLFYDDAVYWLFKKNEEEDYYKLYEISVTARPGLPAKGYVSLVNILAEDKDDFLQECKDFKVKAKDKGGLVYLDSLQNDLFFYHKSNPQEFTFSTDPALDVVVKAIDCSPGKPHQWLDSAQYDILKLDKAMTDQRGNSVNEYLVIDESGIYSYPESDHAAILYLYKPNDPNYAFQKIEGGYLTLRRRPSGYFDLTVISMKGKNASLSELKLENHAFYSLSEKGIMDGVTTYFLCNELEKYLLYGLAEKGSFTGNKFHW